MTEKQAWAYVADQFRGDWWKSCDGMCMELEFLQMDKRITNGVYKRMRAKIQRELKRRGLTSFGYLYPHTKYGARMRVQFAMRYAK